MVKFIFVKSKRKVLFLAAEIDFFEQNCVRALEPSLREAARIFRESKISNEKSNFFLFYQNIPFCELVSKKIF